MSGHIPGWLVAAVERVATEQGVALYDIEISGRVLRIAIESPRGTSLDACARFSHALSAELDYRDLMSGRYFLEVTSPGIERKLRRPEDFIRALGQMVKVVSSIGPLEGRLVAADADGIAVELDPAKGAAETRFLEYRQVTRAQVRVSDEELFSDNRDRRQSSKRNDE